MKKLYSGFFLLFISFVVRSQTGLVWSSAVPVSSGTYSNIYPRLTLVTGNKALVTWENDVNGNLYSSRWTGSAFATPVKVNPVGVMPFVAAWAGAEVAASGDTVFVVFSTDDVLTGKVYAIRSINGGLSYGDTVRVDQPGQIPRFPAVAVMPGGNPVVNYMTINSSTMSGAEYALSRSLNGGGNYSPALVPSLSAPGDVCDCCPGSITVSGNRHALMYRNNDSNIRDIWASFSSDSGTTYPVSMEVDQSNWMIMSCPSSGPSGIINGDTLTTVWMSDATGDGSIYAGTSSMSNQQVGLNRMVFPTPGKNQNYPVIAGRGDTLGVVWQGVNAGAWDVMFTYSLTGASGLGFTVDTVTRSTGGNQIRPDLEYANGKFHLTYSDDIGGNVKYRTATINTSTIIEESSAEFSFNSFYSDNTIHLRIKSVKSFHAMCRLYNAIGQQAGISELNIEEGANEYHIPAELRNGIYFIVIKDEYGNLFTSKLTIIKK
jgi:hypothetical protein